MLTKKGIVGAVAACFLGTGLGLSLGAGAAAPATTRPGPKYSVQYAGAVLLITDNDANKLHVYKNTGGKSSELLQTVDLNDTGKAELVATKP